MSESGRRDLVDTFRRNRAVVIAFGVFLVLVLIRIGLFLTDDQNQPFDLAGITTTIATEGSPPSAGTTGSATKPDSEVPPVECAALLTSDERTEALAIFARPSEEWGSVMLSRSEVCVETLSADEDYFVRIEPGNPDDFRDGAMLNETTGEPVDLGDGALWFGGDAIGLMSVRKDTLLGALHFRIVLGRPDLDDTSRREIVLDLASKALYRFPGVEREPLLAMFPAEPPDRSMGGYVDNLVAKVENGDWTLGEGLRATLRLFAGEEEAGEVLRHTDLLDYEGTGILEMARDYLDDGTDPSVRADIERLLNLLVFTNEDLEAMAGIGPTTVALGGATGIGLAQTAEEDCDRLFGEALGVSKCLEVESFQINGKEFRVFRPAPSLPQLGWTQQKYELAVTAIKESVPKLDGYGTTPATNLVFSTSGHKYAEADYVDGRPCGIFVYTKLQPFTDSDFKQVIAHELGHCLNGATFNAQKDVDYETRKWWEEGLADYWSNLVYIGNNLEWRTLGPLAQVELATTVLERSYSNAIFFQYLESPLAVAGIKSMISSLPGSGGLAEQERKLAEFPGMPELYHDFARAMADKQVLDTSDVVVPYQAVGWDLPLIGPTEVPFTVPPFGVRRLHIVVPPGMYACYETFAQGDQLVSWRDGGLGEPGTWDEIGPTELQGETTLLVTAVTDGAQFTLDVLDVDDDPDCSDEPKEDECDLSLICSPSGYFFRIDSGD